jgi:hypothetical protein
VAHATPMSFTSLSLPNPVPFSSPSLSLSPKFSDLRKSRRPRGRQGAQTVGTGAGGFGSWQRWRRSVQVGAGASQSFSPDLEKKAVTGWWATTATGCALSRQRQSQGDGKKKMNRRQS